MSITRRNKAMRAQRRMIAGLNLVETGIILAVVGLMLGTIWVIGAAVYTNNQVRVSLQQLVSITQNVRALYAEQGGITNGSNSSNINQVLDQFKVFPLDMRQTPQPSGIVSNIWDQATLTNSGGFSTGSVQVYADDCVGNEGAATLQTCFGVTYLNVPKAACIKLLSQSNGGTGLQLVIIRNGGGVVAGGAPGSGAPPNLPLPVAPSLGTGYCDNSNANGTNNIQWVYLIRGS